MIEVLYLPYDEKGIFIERVNRFVAKIMIKDKIVEAHIHDTGRLSELLYRGNKILLKRAKNKKRKTEWDVISAFFDGDWILTNSTYHSEIFLKTLEKASLFNKHHFEILKEIKFGKSRLDFKLKEDNREILVEVKGCTLRKNHVALFPDAPTLRGTRHVYELIKGIEEGYDAYLVFVIMHKKAQCFAPNIEQDKSFYKAFYTALQHGVKIYPLKYFYDTQDVYFIEKIPLCLENLNLYS